MRQWCLFTSTDIDRFGSTPSFRIFVPNYIPTGVTGDQKVEILVGIQIDSADVVRTLVLANEMSGKFPTPIVLVPNHHTRRVATTRGNINVAIRVDVDSCETMRSFNLRIDFDWVELRTWKPQYSATVSSCCYKVNASITIYIDRLNVGCSWLRIGKRMFFLRRSCVGRLFPPSEPLTARKTIAAFGRTADIWTAIFVHISKSRVM